jgi:MFS family permease
MDNAIQYSRFRWVILGVILVTSVCSAMMLISIAPLMGVVAKDLGIDLGRASFSFMGLHFLATALSCIVSGFLIDRFGLYRVLVLSLVGLAAANAALPLVGHSFEGVLAVRVLEGIFCAPIIVAVGPVVATWFPIKEKGMANGLQSVAISLGIVTGLVAAPALAEAAGNWQGGVAWLSVLPMTALLFVLWVASSPYAQPTVLTEFNQTAINQSSNAEEHYFKQALRKAGFWAGALVYCFGSWTQQAFNDLTPGYFAVGAPVGIGFGALMAGKIMSIVMVAGIVGSLLVGVLVDRVFKGNTKPMILLGFTMLAIGCTAIKFPAIYGNQVLLTGSLILAGVGTPFIMPSVLTFATTSFPPSIVGRVVGIWAGMGLFSGAIAVMIGAGALHNTGNYQLSILIVGAMAVVGFLIALFISKPKFVSANSADHSVPV